MTIQNDNINYVFQLGNIIIQLDRL